ncbi:uncharacterized protein GIQ15_02744 [Arthroderma uncinatum]|uniref:uncharacterized protein n=1 Tax=Arthroderma uncinatum TaxID=74035 RepID=UPI00144A959B|nr:uncharacterized protein GIQ15_02744 [Arthroderma uncinatum]KAF3483420.1 hypothetical protein GIQ15_02744 [Arthroderma uncinatum]
MAKPKVTPWKVPSQLVSVRDQFYPKSSDEQDSRAKACSLVWVWKVRGNLPHAVEATALLTDAILHDDPSKNSIFSIRAAYSFVTGLVDSKLHGRKQSMYQKAMAVGVPASFVELRHEATHRDLPSLVVLRNAAQRSMEWLWDFYWATVEDDCNFVSDAPGVAGREDAEDENMGPLRDAVWVTLRPLVDLINKPRKSDRTSAKAGSLLGEEERSMRKLGAFCCRESAAGAVLVQALLDPDLDILVSTVQESDGEDELRSPFTAWDEVLRGICRYHPPFTTTLVEEMASILIAADTKGSNNDKGQILTDLEDDSYEENVFSWLEHILTSEIWATICNRYLILSHLEASCGAPGTSAGFWAKRIHDLLSHQQYEDSMIHTRPSSTSEEMEVDTAGPSAAPDTSADHDSDIAVLRGYGWDFGQKITYKPIGSTV